MPQSKTEFPRQRRPGGRSARVVASVFAATIDVLIDRGYRGLSIGEIAERSGVHETSIYRRWGTKAQLVGEAVSRNAAQTIPSSDTGTFHGDIRALFRRVNSWLDSPLGRAVSQVVTSSDPDLLDLRKQYWSARLDGIREIVARAAARGEVPKSLDVRLVIEVCAGPIILRQISGESVTPRYVKNLLDRVIPALQK
jgi:AcrR family transcriptional regulator